MTHVYGSNPQGQEAIYMHVCVCACTHVCVYAMYLYLYFNKCQSTCTLRTDFHMYFAPYPKRENFTGLNFHGIQIAWIFLVILSLCKARALSYMLYLEQKIHGKIFRALLKNWKNLVLF